jgi:hypothetical protein
VVKFFQLKLCWDSRPASPLDQFGSAQFGSFNVTSQFSAVDTFRVASSPVDGPIGQSDECNSYLSGVVLRGANTTFPNNVYPDIAVAKFTQAEGGAFVWFLVSNVVPPARGVAMRLALIGSGHITQSWQILYRSGSSITIANVCCGITCPICIDGCLRFDLNPTWTIDAFDLLILLSQWGPCSGPATCYGGCAADFNGDNNVNALDLLSLLAAWGTCWLLYWYVETEYCTKIDSMIPITAFRYSILHCHWQALGF